MNIVLALAVLTVASRRRHALHTAATANGVGDFSSYFYDVETAGTYTVTLTAASDDVELQLQGFIKNADGSRGGIVSGPDVACNDLNAGAFSGTCSVTLDAPSYLGIVMLGGFTDDDFGAVFTITVAETH